MLGATGSGWTGLESGGRGAATGLRLARTTLRLGLDARVDESPKDVYGADFLAEIEPHAAFGADAWYGRRVGSQFLLHAGVTAFALPSSLVGTTFGASWRPTLVEELGLVVGPRFQSYYFGSDLPDGGLVWQVVLEAGFHVDL
jgi:hypothetical protein